MAKKREYTYEVWAEGYDANDRITDYDVWVCDGEKNAMIDKLYDLARDPEAALKELNELQKIPADVKRITLYVEKCHYDGFETVADDTIAEESIDIA